MHWYVEAKVRSARFWNQLGVFRLKNGCEGAERAFEKARQEIALARSA